MCANCHREIHEGFYTTEDLKSKVVFNQELAESFLTLAQEQKPKPRTGKKSNKIPSREVLKDLIRNKTFLDIGI